MLIGLKLAVVAAAPLFFSNSAFAAAPLDAFKGKEGKIDIAGGTAHIPVMKGAAQQIMEANPAIRITVAGGGSGVGVQKVGEGLVEIGNTGRALKEKEIAQYGLKSFPFAIDGVAAAVNPQNPINGLDQAQLIEIFAGNVKNWKEVGGNDAPITLYVREDGSGTRETFEERGLNKGKSAPNANVINSNGSMKTAIAQDPNAIGYVGIGHLDESVKGLAVNGKTPTQENAASGEYPITRLLYMNTKGEPKGIVEDFIEYIYSPAGAELIKAAGYIPNKK